MTKNKGSLKSDKYNSQKLPFNISTKNLRKKEIESKKIKILHKHN